MLKKLIAIAGLVGTLGAAAPAFADWHHAGGAYRPVARPGYGYGVRRGYGYGGVRPGYGYGVAGPGYGYGYGYGVRRWEPRRWEGHHPRYYRHW